MSTFKLFFSDEIRRYSFDSNPSYDDFIATLTRVMHPKFHPEMSLTYQDEEGDKISVGSEVEWQEMLRQAPDGVHRLYVADSPHYQFKSAPTPSAGVVYPASDPLARREVSLEDEPRLRQVRDCLASLFPDGRILPYNLPEFLRSVIPVKTLTEVDVDLDVPVQALADALHREAYGRIRANDLNGLRIARKYLEALMILEPQDAVAKYNYACTLSLLGEEGGAVAALRGAVDAGYDNVDHIEKDTDLDPIRSTLGYMQLLSQMRLRRRSYAPPSAMAADPMSVDVPEQKPVRVSVPVPLAQQAVSVQEEVIEEEVEDEKVNESPTGPMTRFLGELAALHEMGFIGRDGELAALLEKHQGVVESVLIELLESS